MFYSNKSKLQTRTDFAVLRVRELFQIPLQPPPSFAKATDGKPVLPFVDFFLLAKKGAQRRRRMSSEALAKPGYTLIITFPLKHALWQACLAVRRLNQIPLRTSPYIPVHPTPEKYKKAVSLFR